MGSFLHTMLASHWRNHMSTAKQIEEAIDTLHAIRHFRSGYGSTEDGHRLCTEATKLLRGGGLLSSNIATAIEAYLVNKTVEVGGPPQA